jgi:OCT family organic cation transporter-like MFS transporter 4/5
MVMSFVSTAHSQPHINEQITPYLSSGPSSTHSVKTGSRGTTTGIDYDATDDFEDAPATHTIDDIIEHIGGFGRYQQRLFVLLGFTFLVNGMLNLQQIVVEREAQTSCSSLAESVLPNANAKCEDCIADGQVFVGRFFQNASVAEEFGLVCSRAVLRGYIGSVFFGGFIVGSYFGGMLSDLIGRRNTIFLVHGTMCAGSLSALAWTYSIYLALRFIAGVGCGSGIVVNYVLMQEVVGAKFRGLSGVGLQVLFATSKAGLLVLQYKY